MNVAERKAVEVVQREREREDRRWCLQTENALSLLLLRLLSPVLLPLVLLCVLLSEPFLLSERNLFPRP